MQSTDGTDFAPEGFTLGSSFAEFNSVYAQGNNSANLFVVLVTDSSYDPILVTDQGFVVKKDITAGGFIGSNQGQLILGHGRDSATEPPRIKLMHTSDAGWNPFSNA